jgi:hypothetical protein
VILPGPRPSIADPQITPVTQLVGQSPLDHAIRQNEPWLRAALNFIADGDTTQLNDGAATWLAELAAIRADNQIPPAAPLDTLVWPASHVRDIDSIGASADHGIDL